MMQRGILLIDHGIERKRLLVKLPGDWLGRPNHDPAADVRPGLAGWLTSRIEHGSPANGSDGWTVLRSNANFNSPLAVGWKVHRSLDLHLTKFLHSFRQTGGPHCLSQQFSRHHRREERAAVLGVLQQKLIPGRIELKADVRHGPLGRDGRHQTPAASVSQRRSRWLGRQCCRGRLSDWAGSFTEGWLGQNHFGSRQTTGYFSKEVPHTLGERHELQTKLFKHETTLWPAGHANLVPGVPVENRRGNAVTMPQLCHDLRQQVICQGIIGLSMSAEPAARRTKTDHGPQLLRIDRGQQVLKPQHLRANSGRQPGRRLLLKPAGCLVAGTVEQAPNRTNRPLNLGHQPACGNFIGKVAGKVLCRHPSGGTGRQRAGDLERFLNRPPGLPGIFAPSLGLDHQLTFELPEASLVALEPI